MENRIRILLVDDSITIRKALTHHLEQFKDIEVVGEAGDGVECLRLIPILNPNVIILDLEMPKKTGYQTLRTMRDKKNNTPVIILSSIAEMNPVLVQELYILGAYYVLKKPEGSEFIGGMIDKIRDAAKSVQQ